MVHSNPEKVWTVAEIFQMIQSTQISVQHRLLQLQADGLVVAEGDGYRFAPGKSDLANCVSSLAENYKDRRVRIIEAIYAPRKDPAQTFADAFKLRRKD